MSIKYIISSVVIYILFSSSASIAEQLDPRKFSGHNLQMQALKLSVINENINLEEVNHNVIMYMFTQDEYLKSEENAFALRKLYPKALKIAKQKIAQWNEKQPFIIYANLDFAKYNFDAHKFSFRPFTKDVYYSKKSDWWFGNDKNYGYIVSNTNFKEYPWTPDTFAVFFDNSSLVDGLPMPEDKASKFIDSRTDENGNVNRKIIGVLIFTINGFSTERSNSLSNSRSGEYTAFTGSFTTVKIYPDENSTEMLYEYK